MRGSLIADLTRDEERFRALMREPVNDLSPAARELVARIERAPAHDFGALVRTANHQPALAELRHFIATVRERFGVPGSLELDRDRLVQATTNATPERLEAFTAGFSRAQSIVSRVEASQRANNLQMGHDQQHSRDKGKTFEL